MAATAAAALIAIPALTHEPRRVAVTPGNRPTTVVTPQPAPPRRRPGLTSPSPAPAVGSPRRRSPPTTTPVARFAYQPLYPFRTLQEATAWQASYQATGVQPWHLDPGLTALSFTGFLGYTDVTTVFGVRTDAIGAHVTVGFPNPNGAPVNAAVLHLRRFGTAADAPWEVVGTDDTARLQLSPPRGTGRSEVPADSGGRHRRRGREHQGPGAAAVVHDTARGLLLPAGRQLGSPVGRRGLVQGATDKVLIVAASTGGHLATVERFTVTGVRTSAGSTPGL